MKRLVINIEKNDTLLSVSLYLAALARLLRYGTYDASFEKHKAMLRANAALRESHSECICQRMLDKGDTGVSHIDRWLDTLNWPTDWYAQVYKGQLDEELPLDLARKIKYRIEQFCTAPIHYPSVLADDMYGGRAVYTSLDDVKLAENRERSEDDAFDNAHPWEVRARFEYKGADADADDVLTHQRDNQDTPSKGGTVQMSFDPSLTSPAQRRALSNIKRESEPTPFDKLVFANKRRIRAKNEQARRDCWMLIRKTDEDTQRLLIAFVQEQREARVSFVNIRAALRQTTRSLVAA